MKTSRLIFAIALIIISAWILGVPLKLTAWLIGGLPYIAVIIVIIGIIMAFLESRHKK